MAIFPGLPDDIGRECLLRVSCTSHYKLAAVCKSWKNIVCSPLFYQDRKRFGMSQELIILPYWDEEKEKSISSRIKLYDPLLKSCETLPPFPPEFPYVSCCSYCVPLNHKLFLMGLLTDYPEFTIHKALLIYDFSSGRWKRGPDLPDCRYNFSCSVDSAKGLIYIAGGVNCTAGGCDNDEEELCTAAVYNVEEEQWEYLPPMSWSEYECHSVFTDNKLYVVSHVGGHIQAYDPNIRQWSPRSSCEDGNMQPSFAAFERIYHDFQGEIREWDYVENVLRIIGTRPPELYIFIGATMWHQQIVMVGRDNESDMVFFLFEPSIPGEHGEAEKQDKWTLINTLSLPELVTTVGTLAL